MREQAQLPIFVISLADAHHRQSRIASALEAHGLAYEFVPAVDGRNGLDPTLEKLIDRRAGARNMRYEMTDAEFACALSHQSVYRLVCDRKIPAAIVLEDDAEVSAEFATLARGNGCTQASLILFQHQIARVFLSKPLSLDAGITAYPLATSPTLAGAYSVRLDGAERLAALSYPISRAADWPIDIATIGAYAVHPIIVPPAPDAKRTSTLEPQRQKAGKASIRRIFERGYFRRSLRKKLATRIS